jgi:hypothetical protein
MTINTEENWLIPGTVVKIYTYNTIPPKLKRCVIIGFVDSPNTVALVYFNSNPPSSPFVEPYQIEFSGSEDFLEHHCYLDCAQLYEETEEWIKYEVANNEYSCILGRLSEIDFKKVMLTIKNAKTISIKTKKKYGIT